MFIVPTIALVSIPLKPIYAILILLIVAILSRKRDKVLRDVSILSTLLLALTYLGLSKPIVLASMFILLGHKFKRNVIWNILIYTILGFAFFVIYDHFNHLNWGLEYIVFLSLMGGLTASLIESVGGNEVVILLAVATVYTIFHIYAIEVPLDQLAVAFAISFILSLLATKSGVADESGLLSATLIGTLTIVFSDIRFFVILLLFYGIGSAVTKYKYSVKLARGIAEQAGGARGYANVFSNSLPALFFVMNYGVFKSDLFLTAFVASIATALGDTMASEVGKTAEKVYLITNFKRVEPGVSGGISLLGEIAALMGCSVVCLSAVLLGVLSVKLAIVAFLAGFIGVHVDSILGATLEKRRYLNNAGVNFLATLSSGLFCYLLLK